VDIELEDLGWTVVRVWDFEVKRDLPAVVAKVKAVLAEA
jgi:very-short-patch-repair endonuclease